MNKQNFTVTRAEYNKNNNSHILYAEQRISIEADSLTTKEEVYSKIFKERFQVLKIEELGDDQKWHSI